MPQRSLRGAVLVVALIGCAPSAEDFLFVFGSLEAPNGTPSGGTVTLLRRDCARAECHPFVEDPDTQFFPFAEVQADADGQWMLELTRFDATIYSRNGTTSRTFKAVVRTDPTLPAVEATYNHEEGDADLPPLRQWAPQAVVELAQDGDTLRVGTSAAPPLPVQNVSHLDLPGLPFETERTGRYGIALLNAGDQEVWFYPAGLEEALPLEFLEDFVTRFQVIATHTGPWFAPSLFGGPTHSQVEQRFPVRELPHAPRLPVSRGAPCDLLGENLERLATLVPCPVTDGRPGAEGFFTSTTALEVTLEVPTSLTRVSLHDVQVNAGSSTLRVEAFDGTRWNLVSEETRAWPAASVGSRWVAAVQTSFTFVADVPAGLGAVHAVRVLPVATHPEGAPEIYAAGEISLFGG